MIEVPRGALTAAEIAKTAEFFSFGTNDLTQTTLGVSRDGCGSIPGSLCSKWKSYAKDPFEALDGDGVGQLMKIAVTQGRSTRPRLKSGHLR